MKKFGGKGGVSKKILTTLCLAGEIPYISLRLLEGNIGTIQKTARGMIKKGVLKDARVYGVRTLSLNYENLESFNTSRRCVIEPYENAFENAKTFRSTMNRTQENSKIGRTIRMRSMSMSETEIIMKEAGLNTYPWEKPLLKDDGVPTPVENAYFNTTEIKKEMPYEKVRASSGRIMGVMLLDNQYFAIYNFFSGIPRIRTLTEQRTRDRIEQTLNTCINGGKLQHGKPKLIDSAMVFSRKSDTLYQLVRGKRKGSDTVVDFMVDGTYSKYYVLTSDKTGIKILKMMAQKNGIETLLGLPFKESERKRKGSGQKTADARRNDGMFMLSMLVPEIAKLKRFISGANKSLRINDDAMFKIYCYDYQYEEILRLASRNIEVFPFSLDLVEKKFYEKISESNKEGKDV